MSEVRHDPKTGQHYVYRPGAGDWVEVTREQALAASRSFGENAAREFGAQAQDAAGFFADALEAPFRRSASIAEGIAAGDWGSRERALSGGDTAGRRMMQANDPAQAGRMQEAPGAALAGFAAALALPGGPAANSTRGMSGGAITRRMTQTAQDVVEQSRAARQISDMNLQAGPAGGGPGGSSGAAELAGGSRLRRRGEEMIFRDGNPKVESVRAADELGIPLTPGMRRGSPSQQIAEEALSRNPGALSVFQREISDPTEAKITGYAREAFGIGPGDKLTRDDFTRGADAISAEFSDIAESIPGKTLIAETDVQTMMNNVAGVTRDSRIQEKVYRSWIKQFADNLEKETPMSQLPFNAARMDAKDIWGMVRELNAAIAESTSDAERRALESLRDFWELRFENMAGGASSDVRGRIKNVNEKYRVQKLLESSGVLRGEDLNPRILSNAAQRQFKDAMLRSDFVDGRGRRFEPDTVNLLRSLQVIRDFPALLGNSGTPTGLALAEGGAGAVSSMLGSRAGAEMYFGHPFRAGLAGAGAALGALGNAVPGR